MTHAITKKPERPWVICRGPLDAREYLQNRGVAPPPVWTRHIYQALHFTLRDARRISAKLAGRISLFDSRTHPCTDKDPPQ